ncbi:hypothetical protein AKJ44_01925 [candidate division MSBL1 archaeon SCGC-AAA261F17]|uniref:Core-binding (CB) domain-containing protein n=1 Tax=candidate division MSBL1 archaeon SCGC-AAA261F17 TaxID=1698274 RepID=A0A133V635_9EURY|nr:hypothetical protein AKJ44_01925 [candidate division MSBL1 archaeon SCGC-AAA261F17]
MKESGEREKEPWEIIQDENEELINEFSDYLHEVKGLSKRTVDIHVYNLRMLNYYVAGYNCERLEETTPLDVSFFMNDWYIRKVAANEETMHKMPVSLKKFFTFLSHEKGFDMPLEEIVEICSDRKRFKKRLREWMDPEAIDGWWTSST